MRTLSDVWIGRQLQNCRVHVKYTVLVVLTGPLTMPGETGDRLANQCGPDGQVDLEEPLLVDAFDERQASKKCTWQQTTAALLSLQLGWGLWLFPSDFARLGWIPALGKQHLQILSNHPCKGPCTQLLFLKASLSNETSSWNMRAPEQAPARQHRKLP